MRKLIISRFACVALVALLCAGYANAFNVSNYATQSKLATGKWVKISIPESGVYEITYDELRDMGFNNPEQVRLYGNGGYRISEYLNGKAIDDLVPVSVMRANNKMVFYGKGSINFSMTGYNGTPHYQREFNPYSQVGCYFLTEESSSELQVPKKPVVTVSNYINTPTCLSYFWYENELASASNTGKELLGEDFTSGGLLVDYFLPDLVDSILVVNTVIAASANRISYANAVIHSDGGTDTTVYTTSSSRIYVPSNESVYYNYASPYGFIQLSHPSETGQFEPLLTSTDNDISVSFARLDYFILTYQRNNIIRADEDNQILMGYAPSRGNERFQLPGAPENTAVWSIDANNNNTPQEVTLNEYDDESGQGYSFFSTASNYALFVAFDPSATLKKISSYEPVANQNIHAMPTPDLLIITDKTYHEQAERVAQLHRTVDGIDVVVVDQDQVFNEFSSGTRDAMAYRLLCKMFYDRDPSKFKNLLLFGTGTIDNRQLMGEREGYLLTYQSDNSNYEDFSFSTDDFFAYLQDNSGTNMASEKMNIGVGRITCSNLEEARSDVDKLIEYYATPDYGVWRNNNLVTSDSPDEGLYMFQGEGYKLQIDNELNTGMHVNTVHNSQYPRSATQPTIAVDSKTATTAKELMKRDLKSGAYFATYVGHAGAVAFTKRNFMWVNSDVASTSYRRFPIFSTACCNAARFDGDTRGIGELMFHKRDGGAIALLTTSRLCYANGNDKINSYFIEGMFSYDANGVMPTLGEAYMYSKNAFSGTENNKMKFFLLGDPAIKINYPISLFNITRVNTTDMTDSTAIAEIAPLMKFDIEAQVVDEEGNPDNTFNGDATATLYDKELYFTSLTKTVNGETVDRDIYFNRAKLAEVSGRVVNGVFQGQMVVPNDPRAVNERVLLRVYAHKDNSDRMVNGFTKQITMLPFDEALAINDDQAPVVTSMFINDEETFTNGAIASTEAMLYITATDNEGINIQSSSIDNCMTLVLDGGKPSYADVACYVTTSDAGKVANIEYPLNNLTEGLHTLTFTVYDVMGNSATQTITFMVGQGGMATLVADKWPAYNNEEVVFDLESSMNLAPEMTIRVTDATGQVVWMTNANSFPVTWDMKDMDGNSVPAGLYRYFGTYNNGVNYGGTPISKLIVLDPVKTPLKASVK